MKKAMLAAAAAAGLAAAYTVGAGVHGGPKPEPAVERPAEEAAVRMPEMVPPPTVDPGVNIPNPSGVLLGEVKVPDNLLRPPEPPARPELIVPDLSKQ